MMTRFPKAHQAFCTNLQLFQQQQFTGCVDVAIATGQQWSLYLSFGHLVWATGSVHPTRRLRRQLSRQMPQVSLKTISPRDSDRFECWDYHILTILTQRKVTSTEAILAVMRGIISEVLFDIFQHIEIASVTQHLGNQDTPEAIISSKPIPGSFQLNPKIGTRPSNSDTA
ncbi:MAG: hypothetical protein SAJ12_18790 [Jaaginema sp. PMC 1079.18]|nr:hypothetical protein [Jaaginema sp. PMC 1080.18]MEC4853034.1 hypothetical protein [Jaaginema sp. PMC 1079.18]MEC4865797.1 hypothetical protein [Jaaginema sp. PMC 1078.18]